MPRTETKTGETPASYGRAAGTSKDPDGGYQLKAGSELPPLLFDDDQVLALAVSLRLATVAGAGVVEAAARALTTVRQVMPSRLRHRLDALEFTAMGPGAGGSGSTDSSTVTPKALVALSAAVRARKVVRFAYTGQVLAAGDDAPFPVASSPLNPPRRAEPHHAVSREGRLYLVAWDLDRDDWRTFRVDRMTLRTPNGPRHEPRELPGGVSVAEFVAARFTGSTDGDRWPCRGSVVLAAPADQVQPFVGDGTVEPLGDGRCRVALGAWSWVALAAAFARFNVDVSEAEPAALIEAFGRLGARLRRRTVVVDSRPVPPVGLARGPHFLRELYP